MGVDGMPKKREEETVTEAVTWDEPNTTLPVDVFVEAPKRRIVKLANEQTMWLIEDEVRHAFTCSGDAAALMIAVEVVDEDTLRQWPQGDVYAP